MGTAWDRALHARVPTVIDVVADPEVAPIPPHIEWEQTKSVLKALMSGDPNAGNVVRQGIRQKLTAWMKR